MTTSIYAGAAHGTAAADGRHTGGIFRRAVGDDRWERLGDGLPEESEVRAIAVHPSAPRVIYAGTQYGPYRSADGGDAWKAIGFPDAGMVVWSFLFHPRNPEILYARTAPAAVYRSDDGGHRWRRLLDLKTPGRVAMNFPCRVTRLAIDPTYPDEIYAGLEVDGVLRDDLPQFAFSGRSGASSAPWVGPRPCALPYVPRGRPGSVLSWGGPGRAVWT